MSDGVVILGSFLLAFKAVLIEGSEVAILSVATVGSSVGATCCWGSWLGSWLR